MRKAMVALALFTFLVSSMLVGCGENKEQKSEKAEKSEDKISGSYFNEDDFNEYIKLKADGTVFWRENINSEFIEKQKKHDTQPGFTPMKDKYDKYIKYIEAAGKWRIDGKQIVFIGPLGEVERGRVKGDVLHVDGKVWVKHGGASKASNKKISKSEIAGKYKRIDIEREGSDISEKERGVFTFKKNGTILSSKGIKVGTWKIENGLMQIYGQNERLFISGARIEDNSIRFEKVVRGTLVKINFLKQD